MADTLTINVRDIRYSDKVHVRIPVIGQTNPCSNYDATEDQIRQLMSIPNYEIRDAATGKIINGHNLQEYFPDGGGGGGGGVTPAEVRVMIANSIDATVSSTSKNAIQNKVIKKYVDDNVSGKVDKVSGKGLSTNDYTTTEKTKLGGLADIQSIGDGLSLDNGELSATGGSGDVSRYTVEKVTDDVTGEVTYKLMEQLNNGTAHVIGDIIGIRGNQMLVNYGNEVVLLNTAIASIKEKIDATYNFTTFNELNITTSGKTLKQITDELYAKNLPTNTIVTGQLYSSALPFSGNGEAEVMVNGPAFWWTCKSLTTAPYSWNAIAGGGSWSGVKMDWTPSYFTGKPLDYTAYSGEKLTIHKMT